MSFKKAGLQDVMVKSEFPQFGRWVVKPVKGNETRIKVFADSFIEEGLIDADRRICSDHYEISAGSVPCEKLNRCIASTDT